MLFVQWWYGHNAGCVFPTTIPLSGIDVLLHFLKLRIVLCTRTNYRSFTFGRWIFLYIWAGPHHFVVHFITWLGSVSGCVVFQWCLLLHPGWNDQRLLTLHGAWDRVRESVVLKSYGGCCYSVWVCPLSLGTDVVQSKLWMRISHFTDWTIAHVHIGAGSLEWNALLSVFFTGSSHDSTTVNCLAVNFTIPFLDVDARNSVLCSSKCYGQEFYSISCVERFYPEGVLRSKLPLETVVQIMPMYKLRVLGGSLYLIGVIAMIYNLGNSSYR